jgi:hypothetical protein
MDINLEIDGELFIWNEAKAEKNWRKHGIRFEEAATVFFDPLFVLIDASRNDEPRDAAIGFGASGRLLYVVHIDIEETAIRIISARRAEPNEELAYAF